MSARQVNGVSIMDWEQGPQIPSLASEVKSLLEGGGTLHVLVNMKGCDELRADGLETLTEVLTVCRDRSCPIGMYGLGDRLRQLVRIMDLQPELPPVYEGDESKAVTTIRNGGQPPTPEPQVEFEIDLGNAIAGGAATAPTARFDPSHVGPTSSGVHKMTPESQSDGELLTIFWADLASLGYAIGGEGSDEIMAAVAADPATPTEAIMAAAAETDAGVIDLDEVVPANARGGRHGYVTEKLPVFNIEEGGSDWSAQPSSAAPIQFAPQGVGLTAGPGAMFGGSEPAEFQAIDAGVLAPPPAVVAAAAAAAAAPAEIDDGDETVMIQPGALEAALMQAGLGAAAPAPAVAPQSVPQPPAKDDAEGDETVMFQPGALDAALLAEVAKAAGPPTELEPPPIELAAPAEPASWGDLSEDDQELRRFIHDHAINSALHVQVLDRFLKAQDQAIGPGELQTATGGEAGSVVEIVDQLVQTRLVRRTRSVRVRGGTGFTFATSPRNRSTVVRLLRLWADPGGRTKLSGWLQS